jgi:hypothetical protein
VGGQLRAAATSVSRKEPPVPIGIRGSPGLKVVLDAEVVNRKIRQSVALLSISSILAGM